MARPTLICLGTGTEANGSMKRDLPTSFHFSSDKGSILIEPTSSLRTILSGNLNFPNEMGLFHGEPRLFTSSIKNPAEMLALIHCLLYFSAQQKTLTVFGPVGLEDSCCKVLSSLGIAQSPYWKFFEMEANLTLAINEKLSFTAIEIQQNSFNFDLGLRIELTYTPSVDPERLSHYGITGADIGRVIAGEVIRGIDLSMVARRHLLSPTCLSYLPARPTPRSEPLAFPQGGTLLARIPYLDEHLDLARSQGMLTATEAGQAAALNRTRTVIPVARSSRAWKEVWMRRELEQFDITTSIMKLGDVHHL